MNIQASHSLNVAVPAVAESLQEYGRGVAGGLLFSLPLLYTMEVWQTGLNAHPLRLLVAVAGTFLLLLGYNRHAGLRRDASMIEVVIDSVEELGIGLMLSTLILWMTGRITFDMPATAIVGPVVIEAMIVAIGVSVGTAQLGGGSANAEGMASDAQPNKKEGEGKQGTANEKAANEKVGGAHHGGEDESLPEVTFGGQLVITLCGAVLFAANVAPTDEVSIIATQISSWRLLGLALFSLSLTAVILYYTEFTGARHFVGTRALPAVAVGVVITYVVALIASALILWFFGRFDGEALMTCIAQTIVLGVAGSLGASAGRLLLQ